MAASDGAAECDRIKFNSAQTQFEPGDKSFLHANTSAENKLAKALCKCWTVPRARMQKQHRGTTKWEN